MPNRVLLAVLILLTGGRAWLVAQAPAADPNRRFLEIADFRFESGAVLPTARVAYATFGTLNAARDNAVLLTTSYGADYHVYESQFLKHVTFTPIPSLWGHSAGGGGNPDDARFINERIAAFLKR